MIFAEKQAILRRYEEQVALWRLFIRPLCTNHKQTGFLWILHDCWKRVKRCPKCRGQYTSIGHPEAPDHLMDLYLSCVYGPELVKMLNSPTPTLQAFVESFK